MFSIIILGFVYSHFTLVGSREQSFYKNSDERFYPISGGSVLRGNKDCMTMPKTVGKLLGLGVQTITFPFEIGNGAMHSGSCTANLVTESGQTIDLGSQDNCVKQFQSMTVTIDSNKCGKSCTLITTINADHMVSFIEYYQSCLDLTTSPGSDIPTIPPVVPSSPVVPSPVPIYDPTIPDSSPLSQETLTPLPDMYIPEPEPESRRSRRRQRRKRRRKHWNKY